MWCDELLESSTFFEWFIYFLLALGAFLVDDEVDGRVYRVYLVFKLEKPIVEFIFIVWKLLYCDIVSEKTLNGFALWDFLLRINKWMELLIEILLYWNDYCLLELFLIGIYDVLDNRCDLVIVFCIVVMRWLVIFFFEFILWLDMQDWDWLL
jgi:hypothetical protein